MTPYYEHGGITIYHCDCREVLPLVCDVVVTDPPYGVGLSHKRTKQRGGGVTVRPGQYACDDTPEYVASVVVPVIEQCRQFAKAVVLTPGSRNLWLYPPADDVGCFYSAAGNGMGRWGFTCSHPILFYGSDPYSAAGMGARANSHGQTYPNDANEIGHPCAKPLPMWRWLVARCSLPGMTILDPFMGSGTTLVAAKKLGNSAIGIELEERYCEIAVQRLAQEVLPLDARETWFSGAASLEPAVSVEGDIRRVGLNTSLGPTEIACPLCAVIVKQVSSATLNLALWQHFNWIHTDHMTMRDLDARP